MSEAQPLIAIHEDPTFLDDKRDIEAALIFARRFATKEPFKTREDAGKAADAIKDLSGARKAADAHRLERTAVWRASTDHVNSNYNELVSQAGAAEQALKRKVLAFRRAEEERIAKERREEEARLHREAEEKAEEAQAAAELAAEEPTPEAQELVAETHQEAARAAVATTPAPAPALPKQVRGSFGSLGSQTLVKHEVVDVSKLPPEHTTFNDKTIKAAIKGEKAMAKAEGRPINLELIPGVRIWTEESGISR